MRVEVIGNTGDETLQQLVGVMVPLRPPISGPQKVLQIRQTLGRPCHKGEGLENRDSARPIFLLVTDLSQEKSVIEVLGGNQGEPLGVISSRRIIGGLLLE